MRHVIASIAIILCATSALQAEPIHDAAKAGDVALVRQLVSQGADVSKPNEAGEPPLIIAALAGNADVVAVLLENGSNIEIRNKLGLTALHAAAFAGKLDVAKLLVEKGAVVNDTHNLYKMSPLHAASEEGHADVVAFLIEHQADIEAKERNGYTPLTQAGWREYWDTAALLMKAGASCQSAEVVGDWLYNECTKRK